MEPEGPVAAGERIIRLRTPAVRRAARAALVATLLAAVSACGGDDPAPRSTSTTTESTTTSTTESTTTSTSTSTPASTAPPTAPTSVGPVGLRFELQGVGPVRLGGDGAAAIQDGALVFEQDDVCTAEIDGTTGDDSYSMPAPPRTEVSVTIIDGTVSNYRVDGVWVAAFGVSNSENVDDVADRFRSQGWDVTVSGEDDIFGAGRLEAIRGDDAFTIESDEAGRTEVLSVPGPIYCD